LESQQPTEKQVAAAAFKGLQICNMQSTKLPAQGEWYMVVSHRFGDLTQGLKNFFGMDNALTKVGGIYGVTNWLSFGASRQTYNKIYELTAKYKFANQLERGFPITIVGYNTMDINSGLQKAANPGIKFTDRLAYSSQLLISRKFSDSFSFEIAPIYLHKNLYEYGVEQKKQYFMGVGARYKLSKRLSVNLEYAARMIIVEGFVTPYHNPLSVGLDIETGGHVFQLVVSNSQPMNDVAVFSNTTGNWNGGSLYFGFNMYRVF